MRRIVSRGTAALAEKTSMLAAILDNIDSGMVAFDRDLRIVRWNELFLKTTNLPPGFLHIGQPIVELIRHDAGLGIYGDGDRDALTAERLALVRSRKPHREVQERPDGRILELVARPLPDDGYLILHTDITERSATEDKRRQLEMQLQHSQRLEALGTLAGGIAHDLNNALVPVLSLSRLLAKSLPEASPDREKLDLIHRAGIRGRDLVKQILAFSRKEAPRQEMLDLAAVLDEVLTMLRATTPTTISLRSEIRPVPPILGDSSQFHQVIVNLVTNAADGIADRIGTITVSLGEDDGDKLPTPYLRLSVHDTGCGIPKEVIKRIFEPFFTTKPVGKGTGLGLAVVHGIVTSHGGVIAVESRLGEFSRFDIYLPVVQS